MTNYAKEMEKSLDSIISNIAGVGKVQVMLTLKSGVQYEYEQNQKSTNSRTTDSMNSAQTQENSDTEQSTVLAENENGTQQPVIKAEMQPAVKGVVIVCEGGSDPIVKEEVLQAVMTALNVSATSVSINPMASPSQTVSNK